MQDRPYASELLEVVAEFLETEVLPQLEGRKQFHTRVSINVLRILQREWSSEEDVTRLEWARLTRLLEAGDLEPSSFSTLRRAVQLMNEDLAARIRRGDFDDRWSEVLSAVRETVNEKLRISNPKYEQS